MITKRGIQENEFYKKKSYAKFLQTKSNAKHAEVTPRRKEKNTEVTWKQDRK